MIMEETFDTPISACSSDTYPQNERAPPTPSRDDEALALNQNELTSDAFGNNESAFEDIY